MCVKDTHRSRRRGTFWTGDLPEEQTAAFLSRVCLHSCVFIFAFFDVILHARASSERVKPCDVKASGLGLAYHKLHQCAVLPEDLVHDGLCKTWIYSEGHWHARQ